MEDIYHKLDSRYIDDDIARLDDIKVFTNEEAIKCLEAAGFIDLYTDKDNEIHVDDSMLMKISENISDEMVITLKEFIKIK